MTYAGFSCAFSFFGGKIGLTQRLQLVGGHAREIAANDTNIKIKIF
jgi:hypothetical protein